MNLRCLAGCLTGLLILLPAVVPAQDSQFPASLSAFRFNFINPGARATGMGGAFIGQGNDATGSETNPAGLLFIARPIAFAEFRHIVYTSSRPYSADAAALDIREYGNTVNSPVFLSYVHPFRNWAFAVYRQELAHFDVEYANDNFVVPGTHPQVYVFNRQSVGLDFRLTNYGFTVARKLHETVAAGFSVRLAHMDFSAHETMDLDYYNYDPGFPMFPTMQTKPPYGIGNLITLDDEDWAVSFVAGVQYKPNDWVSLGAVYRYGETHRLHVAFFDNVYLNNHPLIKDYPEFEINVPDRLGMGVSVIPNAEWAFNFDVVRVFYDDLTDQFRRVLDPSVQPYFGWEDGTEVRLGAEYSLPLGTGGSKLSLRAGYYAMPDPSIHYLGGAGTQSGLGVLYPILFPALGTVHHVTVGAGFVKSKTFSLDAAYDHGKDRKQAVVSLMVYF